MHIASIDSGVWRLGATDLFLTGFGQKKEVKNGINK